MTSELTPAKALRRMNLAQAASGKELPVKGMEIVEAWFLGNRLKQFLRDKHLTQEELARRVGVSYRHINRIVLERSEPSLLLALRLSVVLDEPIDRIFKVRIVKRRVARAA